MDYRNAAQTLSLLLGLDIAPIALRFVETAPKDIAPLDQEAPSACAFWRKAEAQVFYAAAEQHYNCPIGVVTMGFSMPQSVQQELMKRAQMMVACGYLAAEEPEQIPGVKKPKVGIVYGPLSKFPLEPDIVLLWLTPAQGMVFSEAMRKCTGIENASPAVLGRPACSALPIALTNGQPTLSFGCAGMRTFTGIREDRLLAAIPCSNLQEFLDVLASTVEANRTMCAFYEGRKANFAV